MAFSDYPIDVRADYPERSSRGWAVLTILLIKFLALIPHFFVLIFLGIAQFFVALVAQVVVAVNGEYPPGMFDFVVGVLRWGTRVAAFILSLNDRYPPFTLQRVDDYPVDVAVERPARSSRMYALFTVIVELIFFAGAITLAVFLIHRGVHRGRAYNFPSNAGTGLLLRQIAALPHYIVLFFLGIAVLVLWVVVQWVILFVARFPRGMFDIVAGFVRWQTRVYGYALGLSDRYPPFTLRAVDSRAVGQAHATTARAGAVHGAWAVGPAGAAVRGAGAFAASGAVVSGPHGPPHAPLLGRHAVDAARGRRGADRVRPARRSRRGPTGLSNSPPTRRALPHAPA